MLKKLMLMELLIDKYMQDLEVLAAELAAAEGYVAYWKALLDAALATS